MGITYTVDFGLLIGFIGLGVAVFLGLRSFRNDILTPITRMNETLAAMRQRLEDIWFVARPQTGTIARELPNLGQIRISAKPGQDSTDYIVDIVARVIDDGMIEKLSQSTGLEEREKEFFGGKVTQVLGLSDRKFRLTLPSTDKAKNTAYMTLFLRWLDTDYFHAREKEISEFEDGILSDS